MNLQKNITSPQTYIGRFAPSPSGLLHFGSLLCALASYLDAKANHGKWLLRIDNIDTPREQVGATSGILKSLEAFGLHWDESVIFQSNNFYFYIDTCIALIEQDLAYPCFCSRKKLAGHEQYPGYCRKLLSANEKKILISSLQKTAEQVFKKNASPALIPVLKNYSLRVLTSGFNLQALDFLDIIQGQQQAPKNFGDFIILRKDSLPSYMLACGLDDLQNDISHIVRGNDLLEASFWQRFLQLQYLNSHQNQSSQQAHAAESTPLNLQYAHHPLILNHLQQKLSKQHYAPEIDNNNKSELLLLALVALGQNPDRQLQLESPEIILKSAIVNWKIENIPREDVALSSLKL